MPFMEGMGSLPGEAVEVAPVRRLADLNQHILRKSLCFIQNDTGYNIEGYL